MGREIRMVPPNWDHPKQENYPDRLQPMYDKSYETARDEWLAGLAAHNREENEGFDYWECGGVPPDRAYYRPWAEDEATWVQLWETVSEGSPVSPPFETREELAVYLAEHGDFWDQKPDYFGRPARGGWGKERADAFVKDGWAPSMVTIVTPGVTVRILESKDIPLEMSHSAD